MFGEALLEFLQEYKKKFPHRNIEVKGDFVVDSKVKESFHICLEGPKTDETQDS